VHTALTYGGPDVFKVAFFPLWSTAYFWTYVSGPVDPTNVLAKFPTRVASPVGHGVFCSSSTELWDGHLLLTGPEENFPDEGSKFTASVDATQATPAWSSGGNLVTERYYPTATVLPNGKVLATSGSKYDVAISLCGRNASGDYGDLISFGLHRNPVFTTSLQGMPGTTPPPRDGQSVATGVDIYNRNVIFGGRCPTCQQRYYNDLWMLVGQTIGINNVEIQWTWAQLGPAQGVSLPMPSARYGHSSVVTPARSSPSACVDRQVIIFGGTDDQSVFNDVWVLDLSYPDPTHPYIVDAYPMTTSSDGTGSPTGLTQHCAMMTGNILSDGTPDPSNPPTMYVFGGTDASGHASNQVWKLTLARGTDNCASDHTHPHWSGMWSRLAPMPLAASGQALATKDENYVPEGGESAPNLKVLLFGGASDAGGTWQLLGDANNANTGLLLEYDLANDTWEDPVTGGTAVPPRLARSTATYDPESGQLLVFGGETTVSPAQTTDYSNDIWSLEESNDTYTWYRGPGPGDNERRGGASMILIGGGGEARIPDIYDPAPQSNSWTAFPASASLRQPTYPYTFVLPDGRIFYAGPGPQTYTLTPDPSIANLSWSKLPNDAVGNGEQGCAAMYRPGRVLRFGGRERERVSETILIGLPNGMNV
jgi:hypothetical protein